MYVENKECLKNRIYCRSLCLPQATLPPAFPVVLLSSWPPARVQKIFTSGDYQAENT